MRLASTALALACGVVAVVALGGARKAWAQLDRSLTPAPCSVLSGHPCHPAFCSVFHNGPCVPQYLRPIGEDLRVIVAATDGTTNDEPQADRRDERRLVDSIRDMFITLRGCWVPPPRDKARSGMEYTVRFAFKRDGELIAPARVTYSTHDVSDAVRSAYGEAVTAALKRCTPMHFSIGMASAIAGKPISIRFIDDRILIGDDRDNGNSGREDSSK